MGELDTLKNIPLIRMVMLKSKEEEKLKGKMINCFMKMSIQMKKGKHTLPKKLKLNWKMVDLRFARLQIMTMKEIP
jgi:hypothetical protein